jgi:hypothetical protein
MRERHGSPREPLPCEHGFHREGVTSRLPLPVVISLWLLVSQGTFCFPWFGPVGLVFLPTSRVVELLFPPARSGGGWLSPSLFGLWWLVICFSLLFLSFWQDCHLKMSSLEEWPSQRVVGGVIFGPFFFFFFLHFLLWFWKPDLHLFADFWLTRTP